MEGKERLAPFVEDEEEWLEQLRQQTSDLKQIIDQALAGVGSVRPPGPKWKVSEFVAWAADRGVAQAQLQGERYEELLRNFLAEKKANVSLREQARAKKDHARARAALGGFAAVQVALKEVCDQNREARIDLSTIARRIMAAIEIAQKSRRTRLGVCEATKAQSARRTALHLLPRPSRSVALQRSFANGLTGFEEGEAWAALVRRIGSLFEEWGISTTVRNDGIGTPFTGFLIALQGHFPSEARRYNSSEIGLAKAIRRVIASSGHERA